MISLDGGKLEMVGMQKKTQIDGNGQNHYKYFYSWVCINPTKDIFVNGDKNKLSCILRISDCL